MELSKFLTATIVAVMLLVQPANAEVIDLQCQVRGSLTWLDIRRDLLKKEENLQIRISEKSSLKQSFFVIDKLDNGKMRSETHFISYSLAGSESYEGDCSGSAGLGGSITFCNNIIKINPQQIYVQHSRTHNFKETGVQSILVEASISRINGSISYRKRNLIPGDMSTEVEDTGTCSRVQARF